MQICIFLSVVGKYGRNGVLWPFHVRRRVIVWTVLELRGKREVRKSASQFKIKIRTCKLFKLPGIWNILSSGSYTAQNDLFWQLDSWSSETSVSNHLTPRNNPEDGRLTSNAAKGDLGTRRAVVVRIHLSWAILVYFLLFHHYACVPKHSLHCRRVTWPKYFFLYLGLLLIRCFILYVGCGTCLWYGIRIVEWQTRIKLQ